MWPRIESYGFVGSPNALGKTKMLVFKNGLKCECSEFETLIKILMLLFKRK